MNKMIKTVLAGLLVVPLIGLSIISNPVSAYTCDDGRTVSDYVDCNYDGPSLPELFQKIINTALYIVGAVSVLMLIYGGIKYTTSGGNTNSVTAAKNTVLYSIVGIVVSISAYAIVQFVISRFE